MGYKHIGGNQPSESETARAAGSVAEAAVGRSVAQSRGWRCAGHHGVFFIQLRGQSSRFRFP